MKPFLIIALLILAYAGYGQKDTTVDRHFLPGQHIEIYRANIGLYTGDGGSASRTIVPYDTVKAVLLVWQRGPVPLQRNVWVTRKGFLVNHAQYPQPDAMGNVPLVNVLPQMGYDKDHMTITGYLDTDRKTPITFTHVWETAFINW